MLPKCSDETGLDLTFLFHRAELGKKERVTGPKSPKPHKIDVKSSLVQ